LSPIFDPNDLQEIVRGALGPPIEALVPELRARLSERYPGHIRGEDEWVFNNAGGAMGAMTVLHASITEYLIIFGSPIGTEGHTGRHYADDWFIILDGEQWAYDPGELDKHVYRPGDMHHLRRGTAQGYRMPDRCWALEYARGWIPTMLPFGFADTFFSTFDVPTLVRTMKIYGRAVVGELVQGKI
jgi:C-8 sterol isomerase